MSTTPNKSDLIVCQLFFFTLAFGFFKIGNRDAGKLLFSMDLASLLLTWRIPLTYMTNLIVYVFVLSYFKRLGLLVVENRTT